MDLTGAVFDERYELLSQLGIGGMGTVYLARDRTFDRSVAIKLLSPDAAGQEEFQKRFKREAQLLAKLHSKHVVQFLGWGYWSANSPYLVMELLNGSSLAQLTVERGCIPWREAFSIALEVCTGLEALHDLGIVHRDLSPANIFLCSTLAESTIKIIDLGLASASATERSDLTSTGLLMGSLHYMSPEVCAGQKATTQSDIYGLGCIAYELITGAKPLSCDNPMGLIYKHTNEYPPPLKKFDPSIPDMVQDIVFKAISKKCDERYSSAASMSCDLKNALAGDTESIAAESWNAEVPAGQLKRSRIALAVLTTVAIALTGGLHLHWRNHTSDHQSTTRAEAMTDRALRYSPNTENINRHVEMAVAMNSPAPAELEKQIDHWLHYKPERLANSNLLYAATVYRHLADYYSQSKDPANLRRINQVCVKLVNRYKPSTEAERQAQLTHQLRLNLAMANAANLAQDGDRYLQQYWNILAQLPPGVGADEDIESVLCTDVCFACSLKKWDRAYRSATECLSYEPGRYATLEIAHLITLLPRTEQIRKFQLLEAITQHAPTAEQPKKWSDDRRLEDSERLAGKTTLPVHQSRVMSVVEACTLEGRPRIAADWLRIYQIYFKARNTALEKAVGLYSSKLNRTAELPAIIAELKNGISKTPSELCLMLEGQRLCAMYPGWFLKQERKAIPDATIESVLETFVALRSADSGMALSMDDWPRDRPRDLKSTIEQFFLCDCTSVPASHRASICRTFAAKPGFESIRLTLLNIAAKLEAS